MDESIESIKNRIKSKRSNHIYQKPKSTQVTNKKVKYFKNLISRFLIASIFVLGSVIYVKYSKENLLMYKKYVLNDTLSFAKINSLYQKYFGDILPFEDIIKETKNTPVFNENLKFTSSEVYKDGMVFEVGINYPVPVINSGIVVFIGEKEDYGNTVIIQGVDGFDIWYAGIDASNIKIYDYIEKGSLLGEVSGENLYLVIQKDGVYTPYDEYIK